MAKKLIKSAEEAEDQFTVDESIVDEVSNAEEFADVEITEEDIMDAVEAIGALADAVIEKADAEQKEIDADELLDEVRDLIDDTHEEPEEGGEEEVELTEEEELPEELTNSAVRVMVSEDGAVELESTPDEVYDSTIDDMECTVFDTCDIPEMDVEETAPSEDTEEDVLVIGNSKATNFKKGFVVLKSSANKKAWSAAYKKVKKMVGSSKLTAAHWVIVSALAKKEEENDKLKKKIECKLVKVICSNKELKSKFSKKFLKSNTEPDIQPEGQPEAETKPEETAGEGNPGYQEEPNDGIPSESGDPDGVEQPVGDPVEDTKELIDREGEIVLPEENIVVVDVPLTNSTRSFRLHKIRSSKTRNYNLYKVIASGKLVDALNGRCIKCGKIAYVFQNTTQGMLACCAKYVDAGKGSYKPVLSENQIVITRGSLAPVFQNYEKIMMAKAIVSARKEGIKEGMKRAAIASRRTVESRRPVNSRVNRNPIVSRKEAEARKEAIRSKAETRFAQKRAEQAIQSKVALQRKFEQEERNRLFQSSQTEMNEEKIAIKSNNTRNSEALNKLYNSMF